MHQSLTLVKVRRNFNCLLVIALFVSSNGVQAQAQNRKSPAARSARLTLFAVPAPERAAPGEAVFLDLRLRNVTDRPVTLEDRSTDIDFALSVRDGSGKEMPRTAYGQQLLVPALLRDSVTALDAHAETREMLEVTRIYQLSLPGIYYATVTRWGLWGESDPTKVEEAVSNIAVFSIGDSGNATAVSSSRTQTEQARAAVDAAHAFLKVTPEQNSVTVAMHEPTIVALDLMNITSTQMLFEFGQSSERDYRVNVLRPNGERVSALRSRWAGNRVWEGTFSSVNLMPASVYRRPTILDEWVSFDEVGTYVVSVSVPQSAEPAVIEVRVMDRDEKQLEGVYRKLADGQIGFPGRTDRSLGTRALTLVDDDVAIPFLVEIAKRNDAVAINGIARRGTIGAVNALNGLAHETNTFVATAAMQELGRLADSAKLDSVKQAAQIALQQ